MGNFIKTQNSFASGEVSPEFLAREDINGLSRLENMDVLGAGGLRRRRGLAPVADLYDAMRLIPFIVSEDQRYILVLSAGHLEVYSGSTMYQDLLVPWKDKDLPQLQYAQRFGTIIFVHPDYQPHVLSKGETRFELNVFNFAINDNMTKNIPFMRFDDADGVKITLTPSNSGSNFATLTTNKPFWQKSNVYGRLFMLGMQWVVTEYVSPTVVVAGVNGGFNMPSNPISDWKEAAFSNRRGWPCSITFHQNRLVFGGSKSWPSGVWMSQVGRHNNFSVGTGLDDEAIFITLISEQRQQICTVVSSDNLQILTSVGEWAISSKPLTPSSVDIKQHTDVGSVSSRYLPPQKIEGSTVFISKNGKDIRELILDELGENYSATDLCALSKHLMQDPIDLAYNDDTHQLFVVMANGDMAVLNKNSSLGISAWSVYKTQGKFLSVTVMDGETYVAVKREDEYKLEKFSDTSMIDGGEFGFSFTVSSLPLRSGGHAPKKVRVRKIGLRVLKTKSVFINGRRVALPNEVYAPEHPGYSGDISVDFLGTNPDTMQPLWTVQSSDALPVTILSVTTSGWYLI